METLFAVVLLISCFLVKADLSLRATNGLLESMNEQLGHIQNLIETCSCKSEPSGSQGPGTNELAPSEANFFLQVSCAPASSSPKNLVPGVFYLDGTGAGTWRSSGFCRVYVKEALQISNYTISADLYNVHSRGNPAYGHLGVFYNAQDINNFDFVYFRFHGTGCYQTGKTVNGVVNFQGGVTSSCSNGSPLGATWFNVKIEVDGQTAKVYRDNFLVVTSRFPAKGSGGVLVANGSKNLGYFRNVKITSN